MTIEIFHQCKEGKRIADLEGVCVEGAIPRTVGLYRIPLGRDQLDMIGKAEFSLKLR